MADKKLEKALYGPSVTEVALGAVLGLICGVLGACLYLVFKPVQQVKVLPKEPSRSVVYYIPGSESSAKSRGWQGKEKQLVAGTNVTVVEDELNAWASSLAAPAAPKAAAPAPKAKAKPGEKPKEEAPKDDAVKPAPEGFVIPGVMNFRIVDDNVQVGLKCTLNWYGMTYDTTVVATGTFGLSGDTIVFKPTKLYLGSCPLHLLPAIPGLLVSGITSKVKIPDDLRVALTKLKSVTVEKGAMTLAVQ
ncbi:MAG TPA: hypothetical protein VL200_02615 [Lacunisphaera sp.]|jgi:hypothetical protein|nr:hypothetical protein [Lacunisphaera sp.]